MNLYLNKYLNSDYRLLLERTPTTAKMVYHGESLEQTPTTAGSACHGLVLEQIPTTARTAWHGMSLEQTPTTVGTEYHVVLLERTPTTAKMVYHGESLEQTPTTAGTASRLMSRLVSILFMLLPVGLLSGQDGQIDIPRVEMMPNEPSPYFMRDWKTVATVYDSFVYDVQKTGEHLPLVFIRPQGVNYPAQASFGLDTYVGTFSNNNGEGINVLPSLVGATLAGIDKTNQFGRNWILMSQDYFNRANGENLYLNNIGGHSGFDWWYDMMPNVYFYQLYDLYGPIGDAQGQFEHVASRMSEAVQAMGGSATPWTKASMNYRAWNFLNMEPNPDGVHEPEAAGAYAWLLYHAYKKTGDASYLRAAEWSMEFLIDLNSNPSYELQLPYGAYTAAKMNAEIGTEYDITKLLNWIFNRGPLRGWGTIVGEWNTFDVSGLVGEANDNGNDYAFQLNGVQQAGALVPLVRYDKRYARAVGKWMLNVANATRFMYPGFLPGHLQDADAWSDANDPDAVIGYEALREQWQGFRPYATGDALKGGWASTNLSLYSTSSIGYMGSLIEKTNEEKILKLDLLKTDFYNETAFPSFLLFNPFSVSKSITIDAGIESKDIYDVLSESFLAENVSGVVAIDIPADQAVSIVLAPTGGTITFQQNKMLINGVVVDYRQSVNPYNYPPRIQSFATQNNTVVKNSTVTLYGKGLDQETNNLTYTFILPDGDVSGPQQTTEWTAPDEEGLIELQLIIEDADQQTDTAVLIIEVVGEINIAPEIIDLTADKKYTSPGGTISLHALVTDLNNDLLIYNWTSAQGEIIGSDDLGEFLAPDEEGIYTVFLMVSDGRGGSASASIALLVLDPSLHTEGDLIAWYPFQGNAEDISGNQLHGQVLGPKLTADSLGNPSSAYLFDGINDHIRVTNGPILNFSNGITVTCFAKPDVIGDKERFLLSHGSWQNRWKISITPERKVRWTLKNKTGQVRDLDSETILDANTKNYHIGASFDGRYMLLYINGQLENFTPFTGEINNSPVDFEIGQIIPDDQMYNFDGLLDEIKIFDYALRPDSIVAESGTIMTNVRDHTGLSYALLNVYPNPVSEILTYTLNGIDGDHVGNNLHVSVSDALGRIVWRGVQTDSNRGQINLSGWSQGMYILQIKNAETMWTGTFIIE